MKRFNLLDEIEKFEKAIKDRDNKYRKLEKKYEEMKSNYYSALIGIMIMLATLIAFYAFK